VGEIASVAPDYQRNIEELLGRIEARFNIDTQIMVDDAAAATFGSVNLQSTILAVLGGFTSIGATAFLVVIYAAFLLAERATFAPKVLASLHDEERAREILEIIAEINHQIGEYLTVKTLINIILGIACLAIFLVMGTDFALFWAIVIGLVNYIPYLGSWIGVMFPVALSVAQTGSLLYTVVLAGLLTAAQVAVGNFIEPRMIGRQLNLSPFVVLVALSIWSALWGVAGAILAVPMTSIVVIILARFPETRFIAGLLAERVDTRPVAGSTRAGQGAAER
jgi:predicted PurR-regulated permease PerM